MLSSRKNATFLVIILLFFTASSAPALDIPRITKEQLKSEIGKPGVTVLDVRTDPDWDSSQFKISGAIREEPSQVDKWMNKYPKDKELVLYCA